MANEKGRANEYSRIVTHTDFDGVVSALLIRELFDVDHVIFIEPWMLQKGEFRARKGDVIVDLPYGEGCSLWFDHHASEGARAGSPTVQGKLDPSAPSCARVIFDHYISSRPELGKFQEIVEACDKIDSAAFTKEDLENPDVYGRISISLRGDDRRKDDEFRLFLLNMLAFQSAEQAVQQPIIRKRVEEKVRELEEWRRGIGAYVSLRGKVIFVDRTRAPPAFPRGQPFWLYLMYPGRAVYLSADNLKYEPDKVKFSCGENIFERLNDVDIGALMARYGGGGHKVSGGCSVPKADMAKVVEELVEALNAPANAPAETARE